MTVPVPGDGPRPPVSMDDLRPPAPEPEAPAAAGAGADVLSPEGVAAIAGVAGTAVAGIYAAIGSALDCEDVWRLTATQRQQLDELSAALVRKYLPTLSTEHPELWAFVILNGIMLGERAARTAAERKRRALELPNGEESMGAGAVAAVPPGPPPAPEPAPKVRQVLP